MNTNEKDAKRRLRMVTSLRILVEGREVQSLDSKSRDSFSSKFNAIKVLITELNNS